MPYNFLIINGPNLGRLGERQPEIYGQTGLAELPNILNNVLGERAQQISCSYFQSNSEGALIDRLEQSYDQKMDALIINAGAYTHTSLALADCLAWIKIPYVEVHLSNTMARPEKIRHKSFIAQNALGVIAGFGINGYALAAIALLENLKNKK